MQNRLKEDLIRAGCLGRSASRRVETYAQLDARHGVTRPEGSAANKEIRDYAVARMREAGLRVSWDRVGNIFGLRPSTGGDTGTVMVGSHLDSVAGGGMFDGALGVFTALEAVSRLHDAGFENRRPIEVVAFTGEEGSAFRPTLLGSSVLSGALEAETALRKQDDAGRTLREVLTEVGYLGEKDRDLRGVDYYIEPHIEQGPVLAGEGISIGVVEAIAGVTWLTLSVTGEENHAGTTPMAARRDALVAAADIVSLVNREARQMVAQTGLPVVATVGKMEVFPGGINVVPGQVTLGIDIRSTDASAMSRLQQTVVAGIEAVAVQHGVSIDIDAPSVHAPQSLSAEVAAVIERAAGAAGIKSRRLSSGAVHDAQNLARQVKAGMLFVPSVAGISHAPLEWTHWEDVEHGAKVLTETLKILSGGVPEDKS